MVEAWLADPANISDLATLSIRCSERIALEIHDGSDDGVRWEPRTLDIAAHRIAHEARTA